MVKEGDRADVFRMDESLIARARVRFVSSSKISLESENFVSSLTESACYYINIYNERQGVVQYKAYLSHLGSKLIEFTDITLIGDNERRRHVKVRTQIQTDINKFIIDGAKVVTLDFPIDILIQNISVGGMFFVSDIMFEVGQHFYVNLKSGRVPFTVLVKILREQAVHGHPYGYGCIFLDCSVHIENLLGAIVMDAQLLEIRKIRGTL